MATLLQREFQIRVTLRFLNIGSKPSGEVLSDIFAFSRFAEKLERRYSLSVDPLQLEYWRHLPSQILDLFEPVSFQEKLELSCIMLYLLLISLNLMP